MAELVLATAMTSEDEPGLLRLPASVARSTSLRLAPSVACCILGRYCDAAVSFPGAGAGNRVPSMLVVCRSSLSLLDAALQHGSSLPQWQEVALSVLRTLVVTSPGESGSCYELGSSEAQAAQLMGRPGRCVPEVATRLSAALRHEAPDQAEQFAFWPSCSSFWMRAGADEADASRLANAAATEAAVWIGAFEPEAQPGMLVAAGLGAEHAGLDAVAAGAPSLRDSPGDALKPWLVLRAALYRTLHALAPRLRLSSLPACSPEHVTGLTGIALADMTSFDAASGLRASTLACVMVRMLGRDLAAGTDPEIVVAACLAARALMGSDSQEVPHEVVAGTPTVHDPWLKDSLIECNPIEHEPQHPAREAVAVTGLARPAAATAAPAAPSLLSVVQAGGSGPGVSHAAAAVDRAAPGRRARTRATQLPVGAGEATITPEARRRALIRCSAVGLLHTQDVDDAGCVKALFGLACEVGDTVRWSTSTALSALHACRVAMAAAASAARVVVRTAEGLVRKRSANDLAACIPDVAGSFALGQERASCPEPAAGAASQVLVVALTSWEGALGAAADACESLGRPAAATARMVLQSWAGLSVLAVTTGKRKGVTTSKAKTPAGARGRKRNRQHPAEERGGSESDWSDSVSDGSADAKTTSASSGIVGASLGVVGCQAALRVLNATIRLQQVCGGCPAAAEAEFRSSAAAAEAWVGWLEANSHSRVLRAQAATTRERLGECSRPPPGVRAAIGTQDDAASEPGRQEGHGSVLPYQLAVGAASSAACKPGLPASAVGDRLTVGQVVSQLAEFAEPHDPGLVTAHVGGHTGAADSGGGRAHRARVMPRNRIVADWVAEEGDAGAAEGVHPDDDWADLDDFIVD